MVILRKVCSILAVAIALPCWCQVEPSAVGGLAEPDENAHMITPPVVSGANLPVDTELGQRSNYLSGGVTLDSAYINNLQPGETSASINDESYSIWPVVILDQRTPRALRLINYSSGFTFYQRTHALDTVNQSMDADFQYRATPRLTVSLKDSFRQNSNVFNQPIFGSGAATSQTPGPLDSGLVIPFDEELKNEVSGLFGYQFAEFAMVGGRVALQSLKFPNVREGSGLYNSRAESALGYYSRRISRSQYLGGFYEQARMVTSQRKTTTQTETFSVFYTLYSRQNLTFSIAAGPQYLEFDMPGFHSYNQWTPSVRASIGWQTTRMRLTTDYSRDITAGQGILGAFASDTADAAARVQLTRSWVVNAIGGYENNKNDIPNSLQGFPGGHSLSGTASAGYNMGEHLVAGAGYTHLHQSYAGVAEISNAPDSDRVFLSVSYYFRRPLGR
jgi:hypothetical protein